MPQPSNEARILLALQALQNNPKLSLRRAAKIYEVGFGTLRNRQNGIQSRDAWVPKSRRLTDLEEQIIVQFLLDLDSRGFPVRLRFVEEIANSLLADRDALPVGKRWAHNFVKRQPELKTRLFRRYDYQRAKCEDPTIIRGWFRLVQNTIVKYGIRSDDIWNFDETGFMMGLIMAGMAVTGSERQGRPKSVQPGNREWITVIQTINAEGQSIAPFIIGAGQYHLANWYRECDLPGDWVIATSQNGWTNNELGLEWLKHFDRSTSNRSVGAYRLLILDGHESHHSADFERYCQDNKIITLCMPPHASHLLQPLDVGCFAVLKQAYGREIEHLIRCSITHISKTEFFPAFYAAFKATFTESNIRGGLRGAGLAPLDPEAVISKLDVQLRTPTPPGEAWCRTPRAAADGSLYSWPDGELVTPDKLAAWLKEDILLRRVAPPQKKPRTRGKGKGKGKAVQLRRQLEQEQLEAAALAEAESLAEALEVPLAEAAELLADDREGYVPPTALAPAAADLAEGSLLTRGTIDAYIAAVIELWRLQVAHGNANTENPRGAAVRGFLEQRGRQRGKHDRASFKDRGTDGIQAGYSPDEWLRVQDLLLSGAAYMPQNLGTRVDLLFGHYYLLRGENRRKMELADLSLLDYPSSEGPTPCGCLVTLLRDGKLNKTAKKEFMGALRHKDPLFCTQGALAQLFFWRWHVAGEPSPSFRRRQDWYRIKVLVGRDREQELSYPTQLQETWRIFGAAGLMASKKTHLPRRVGAQDAETHGTSLAQISQAGRWNQSVLCQAYLTHLPRQFMRIVAGFSASPGDYFLARAAHEPPYVLQKQLWPWIEEWEPRFEARARRQCWAEGGLDDDDLAADGFLKLMRRLRIVLLQDLAVLQPRYPSLPFFAYAPFNGPEWDEFAVAVRSDAVGATEPLSLLVQRALPELSGVLESTREAVLQNSQRLAIRLEARLEGIQDGLDALLQGKVPVTFTGHFGAGPAVSLAPAPAPSTAPTLNFNTAPAPAPEPPVPGMPVVAALAKVFTVRDVWKEWEEGIAGQPAVRVLEETWGSRWRPGNGIRVQFCRRKVI
ncbi:hypothetical protein FOMA001_g13641 [Fusarium oxysporum f. sp. matthiolae]|nr:hypothetical protein FOMA001_g13641 [Fusarium oxysporum f. sp. matthiolae]